MRIARIDRAQARPPAHPEWFPGTVLHQLLNDPADAGGVEAIAVWFEPGSRTRPHVHELDQILQVIKGEGVVATEAEKRLIRAGDWVVVPGGIWHRHGATPESALCHVSIKQPGETDWTVPWGDFDAYMAGAV